MCRRPRATDLETNKTVRQITTNEGMEVHCYLVWDDATREAALFDTGWSADPILALLQEKKLTLIACVRVRRFGRIGRSSTARAGT